MPLYECLRMGFSHARTVAASNTAGRTKQDRAASGGAGVTASS